MSSRKRRNLGGHIETKTKARKQDRERKERHDRKARHEEEVAATKAHDERVRQRRIVQRWVRPGSPLDSLAQATLDAKGYETVIEAVGNLIKPLHLDPELCSLHIIDPLDLFVAVAETYEESGGTQEDLYEAMLFVRELAALPPGILPIMIAYVGPEGRKETDWTRFRSAYKGDGGKWETRWKGFSATDFNTIVLHGNRYRWDKLYEFFDHGWTDRNAEEKLHPLAILGASAWIQDDSPDPPTAMIPTSRLRSTLSRHIRPHLSWIKALTIIFYVLMRASYLSPKRPWNSHRELLQLLVQQAGSLFSIYGDWSEEALNLAAVTQVEKGLEEARFLCQIFTL